MKKTFWILLLCVHVSLISFAQTPTTLTVTESKAYKDPVRAGEILSIHTMKNGQTGIIRQAKKNLLLDIFDESLDKIFTKVVEHPKKESFVGEVFHDDEIKFFTVFSPKKRERILYCHVFNLKEKTHKKVKLFETTVEKARSLFFAQNKRQTSFVISPDGNYFAINTDNYKKNINSYTIRVFDAKSLKLVYKKSYQKYQDKYFEPNDLMIDNDATVYTLGKSFKNGKAERKKKEANYEFVLNKISADDISVLNIKLDTEFIQSLVFSNIDDQLHLLGFYAEKKVGRVKGGCDFVVDRQNLSLVGKKKYELPKSVYDDIFNERASKRKKKKKKELPYFSIDYVLNDDDGNTFLIAEEFYITQAYVSNGQFGGYWTTIFHYDNIMVLKFNSDGGLLWGRSIFKKETFPSYNAFIRNGELQIVLNSGKSLTQKDDGRTKMSKGWFESTALYNVVFSQDGEMTYQKIQDNKGNAYYLPFYGTFENETFIMPSTTKRKKRFMTLK